MNRTENFSEDIYHKGDSFQNTTRTTSEESAHVHSHWYEQSETGLTDFCKKFVFI